jgi:hypothetical protein
MAEGNKGIKGLGYITIAIFVAGFLTHTLIVTPIKLSRWLKVEKDERTPLIKAMSPNGNGWITLATIANLFIYGCFWFLVATILTTIYQPGWEFNHFYTEPRTELIGPHAGERIRVLDKDLAFVWVMISLFTVIFFFWSLYIANYDISNTDYEDPVRDDKYRAKARAKANAEYEAENKDKIAKASKELDELVASIKPPDEL